MSMAMMRFWEAEARISDSFKTGDGESPLQYSAAFTQLEPKRVESYVSAVYDRDAHATPMGCEPDDLSNISLSLSMPFRATIYI